jgi:two-component system sensor histidine kinase KdpD
LPFFSARGIVFASAALSALLWNFLFIPPQLTFSIGSLEDILMFTAFFLAAFVGGFLTSRLKEKESALSLRERRMAFLYGFTLSITKERGREGIVRFAESYLLDHLGLGSAVLLNDSTGCLAAAVGSAAVGSAAAGSAGADPAHGLKDLGYSADLADRCARTKESVMDGQNRMYLPLGYQESVLGVLFVSGRTGKGDAAKNDKRIAGENRELLAALAGNIALALERERLSLENERNKLAGENVRLAKILLNHVSHELRTPLTTIKGAVSGLLEAGTAEDPSLRNALLSETMIAANRLNALVEDLLAMSRLEAGRLLPRIEPAYIGELVGAARIALGNDLDGRSVVLGEESKDAEIEADPALMTQVFRNILRNFAAYTPPGTTLRISYEAAPDGIDRILFADDGPGVPAGELPLLFDTFFRGSGSGKSQGCGLGLSICRGIVEAHGGTIEADKAAGGGLALDLRLPRRAGL